VIDRSRSDTKGSIASAVKVEGGEGLPRHKFEIVQTTVPRCDRFDGFSTFNKLYNNTKKTQFNFNRNKRLEMLERKNEIQCEKTEDR
jgi:hypothetical protein